MSDIANFVYGMMVGVGTTILLVVLWSLMKIAGQISREEEGQLQDDLLKLDMGEALNRSEDHVDHRPD